MKPTIVILKFPGETVMGELVSKTDTTVQLRNPANLFLSPTANGQLSVQMFPVFFKELVEASKREDGTLWTYSLVGAGYADDIAFDEQLMGHYDRTFSNSKIITPHAAGGSKILKMFDDA